MSLTRRQLMQVTAGTAVATSIGGCTQIAREARRAMPKESLAPPTLAVTKDVRLLHRAGFGPSPDSLKHLAELGHEAWVDEQLKAKADEDPLLIAALHALDSEEMEGMELRDIPVNGMLSQIQQAAILRAIYSRNQLKERMIDFWTNHFNIYGRKGLTAYRTPRDQETVIRENALGHFPEMLMASAKSPAMLGYLDNRLSDRVHPNENYAREIMELHSLGVHGGYTQQDIHEVARCLTGWTIEDRFLRRKGTFRFNDEDHDNGAKRVLGQAIPPGGGVKDGERVVEILALHPSTARFISTKLCRYVMGHTEESWVSQTSETYMKTGGDIAAMLRPMLLSPDLQTAPAKLKRPFDFLVSAVRSTQALTDGGQGLLTAMQHMGQPLYEWPMPDGYPDKTDAWISAMLPRWNFAFALGNGAVKGTRINHQEIGGAPFSVRRAAATLLHRPEAEVEEIAAAVQDLNPTHAIGAILASPEFQWR